MQNPRTYGNAPFNVALVHGGPGAPGEMAPLARTLGKQRGILEPLQTADTIWGQIDELVAVLRNHAELPVTLVGSSWGAWLSLLTAAKYPDLVCKLILVSSGPFESKYVPQMNQTRLSRWTRSERKEVESLLKKMETPDATVDENLFARFGTLFSQSDAYDPLPHETENLKAQPDIYQSIWPAADKLRKTGELLESAAKVQCPTVAIHGDYDPHPAEGVRLPLARTIKDFHFVLLPRCGHTPWREKHAKDDFYTTLKKELP